MFGNQRTPTLSGLLGNVGTAPNLAKIGAEQLATGAFAGGMPAQMPMAQGQQPFELQGNPQMFDMGQKAFSLGRTGLETLANIDERLTDVRVPVRPIANFAPTPNPGGQGLQALMQMIARSRY